MRDPENIRELIRLKPDFIGFIFYHKSPRFVAELDEDLIARIPLSIKKVGVFVNEDIETVLELYEKYGLDYVQLHGDEDLEYSQELKKHGVGIIKVFHVLDSLPYSLVSYSEYSDYFLFDTATPDYGGSGRHFDWSILKTYNLDTPVLLSGGIESKDMREVTKLGIKNLVGIDVNSRFEISPAMKDINRIQELKSNL